MRRSRRSRRRGNHTNWGRIAVGLVCIGLLVTGSSLATLSYSAGHVPRESSLNVVSDDVAVHTLDTAQAVHINRTSSLVNVTNNLGKELSVTVTLRNDSTQIGDLVVDGQNYGNQASFTLAKDATETVQIKIPDGSSLTDEVVYFHVNATAPGLTAKAPSRSVPVNA